MQTILVCDDDKQIVEAINIYLTGEGFEVIKAYDSYEALEYLEDHEVNLMIVDVMMPGLDGIRTTLKVRETSSIPIIILSAKSEDTDKILGLNIGADDYITKPFRIRELLSRMKSVLRRYKKTENGVQNLQFGPITISPLQAKVYKNGEELMLTAMEYRLLLTLAQAEGKVLTRNQLLESLWDVGGDYVNDNTLTVYIKRLREKLGEEKLIHTVRGMGYRLGA